MLNRIWSNVKGLNFKKEEEMEWKAYIVLSKNPERDMRLGFLIVKTEEGGGVEDGIKSLIYPDSGWLRQKDQKFEDSLPYITRPGLKKHKMK